MRGLIVVFRILIEKIGRSVESLTVTDNSDRVLVHVNAAEPTQRLVASLQSPRQLPCASSFNRLVGDWWVQSKRHIASVVFLEDAELGALAVSELVQAHRRAHDNNFVVHGYHFINSTRSRETNMSVFCSTCHRIQIVQLKEPLCYRDVDL